MKQSRSTSLKKSIISTAAGFGVSLAAQYTVLPWLGVTASLEQNIKLAVIMTVISILRGYLLERFFEFVGMRVRLSPFAQAVLAERQRQKDAEGWDDAHDDGHYFGELAMAGAAYAIGGFDKPPAIWPWSDEWWKPAGFRRNWVKAAALILAEGEKFDRARKWKSPNSNATLHPTRKPINRLSGAVRGSGHKEGRSA